MKPLVACRWQGLLACAFVFAACQDDDDQHAGAMGGHAGAVTDAGRAGALSGNGGGTVVAGSSAGGASAAASGSGGREQAGAGGEQAGAGGEQAGAGGETGPSSQAGEAGAAGASSVDLRHPPYPPSPYPAENPDSDAKALLGKILFWDEQLSGDNTVACGTCHRPNAGGSDPRASLPAAAQAGADLVLGTDDDIHGSLGVVRCNQQGQHTG